MPRYFTRLANGDYAACNGWIMGAVNVLDNFAESQEFMYFRRRIVIWGELVKLRYGKSKRDAPFLWKRMKHYVQLMAHHFHGFRIDNAHGTPIFVGEYMMRKARKVRPNLVIFAELFANNAQVDALYVKR